MSNTDSGSRKSHLHEDEIDIRDLILPIVNGKYLLILVLIVCAALGYTASKFIPEKYTSEAVLAPIIPEGDKNLGAAGGQLSAISRLTGLNLDQNSNYKITWALEILRSQDFLYNFVIKNNLAIGVLASEGWDANKSEWIIDNSIWNSDQDKWEKYYSPESSKKPSSWYIHKLFTNEILEVNQDSSTGLVHIEITTYSPSESQRWLELLTKEINDNFRQRDILDAKHNIEFLNTQITNTSITELKQIFYDLIYQQTKTIMFANAGNEYILRTLDPPTFPEEKSYPSAKLFTVGASLAGFLAAYAFLLFQHFRKKSIKSDIRDAK